MQALQLLSIVQVFTAYTIQIEDTEFHQNIYLIGYTKFELKLFNCVLILH